MPLTTFAIDRESNQDVNNNSFKICAGVEFNWAILAEFNYKITAITPTNQEQNFDEEARKPTLPRNST